MISSKFRHTYITHLQAADGILEFLLCQRDHRTLLPLPTPRRRPTLTTTSTTDRTINLRPRKSISILRPENSTRYRFASSLRSHHARPRHNHRPRHGPKNGQFPPPLRSQNHPPIFRPSERHSLLHPPPRPLHPILHRLFQRSISLPPRRRHAAPVGARNGQNATLDSQEYWNQASESYRDDVGKGCGYGVE